MWQLLVRWDNYSEGVETTGEIMDVIEGAVIAAKEVSKEIQGFVSTSDFHEISWIFMVCWIFR